MIHKRRGMTLAEICVILAVISIVSLSVVSFVAIASGRSATSAAKLGAIEEMELVEGLVDNWFIVMARDGGKIQNQYGQWVDNPVEVKNNCLIGKWTGYVRMDKGQIRLQLPGDESDTVYEPKTVESISFSAREKKDDQGNLLDTLYYCTVVCVYTVNKQEQTQSYTFCINPRLGETVVLPTEPPAEGNG